MHSVPVLSPADAARLRNLIDSPCLLPSLLRPLGEFLSLAVVAGHENETTDRVALYNRVTLVSPVDSRNWRKLAIVLPEDRDTRAGRLSVLHAAALAVLGRHCGEHVILPGPSQRMSIVSIVKSDAGDLNPTHHELRIL